MDLPEHRRRLASMAFLEALLRGSHAFVVVDFWDQPTSRGPIRIYRVEIEVGEFVLAVPTYIDGILALVDFDLWDQALDLMDRPPGAVC